eukprot:TRINITY_DN11003_c0_g1_i1.p1 TRINITY_DN11003_c0_g1~~TRINITY_DN11003_c0_g1_i1.p1  ORF type:complete len:127 (+),score=51.34 TRINITY_DN11003_c0_g1_i1:220-600(+)
MDVDSFKAAYDAMDKNKDGMISKEELKAALKEHTKDEPPEWLEPHDKAGWTPMPPEEFDQMLDRTVEGVFFSDQDHDGLISFEELKASIEVFMDCKAEDIGAKTQAREEWGGRPPPFLVTRMPSEQ